MAPLDIRLTGTSSFECLDIGFSEGQSSSSSFVIPGDQDPSVSDRDIDASRLARRRQDHLARQLDRAFAAVEAEVRRGMEERGYAIEQVYLPIVRNVALEGSRITDIADRAGLAKQTVGPLVKDLEERGILRVDVDPADGRAKLVRFTDLGLEGLDAGLDAVRSVEQKCARALGAGGLKRLKRDLKNVLEALGGSDRDQ